MTRQEAESVLHITAPYSLRELKKAYRSRAYDTHPDSGGDGLEFSRVRDAFLLLESFVGAVSPGAVREPEPEHRPLEVGDLIPVAWLRCGGETIRGSFQGQLVYLESQAFDKFGDKTVRRLAISISCRPAVEFKGSLVEIVIPDAGSDEVLVREILQRSYNREGKVSSIWVDALRSPIVTEQHSHAHGRYWA